jgi:hypothetical protein
MLFKRKPINDVMEVAKTVVDIGTSFQAKHLEVSSHLIQHSRTNMAMLSLAKLIEQTFNLFSHCVTGILTHNW